MITILPTNQPTNKYKRDKLAVKKKSSLLWYCTSQLIINLEPTFVILIWSRYWHRTNNRRLKHFKSTVGLFVVNWLNITVKWRFPYFYLYIVLRWKKIGLKDFSLFLMQQLDKYVLHRFFWCHCPQKRLCW
jgi:hypothetical protein